MFIAGIDGGGTSTKLEIRTAESRFVRRESFGAFNISAIGEEGFAARLREVLAACGDMADCAAICFGSAGVSVGAAGEIIRRELADAGFAGRLILRGDHEIALRGAITGAGGILIAGTGSICCGVDENGRFARQVSCHQHVIGYSVSHLADCRRCCRSNQHGICPQPQIDMTVP